MRRAALLVSGVMMLVAPGAIAEPAKVSPELKKLDCFIGDWSYSGEVKKNPFIQRDAFKGKVSVRWILGGAHVRAGGDPRLDRLA